MEKETIAFIKLARKIFDHKFWEEERVFSKFEAWIDIIQSARYKKDTKVKIIKNREIKWGYGQFPASESFLMKRWKWSKVKLRNFLKKLESDHKLILNKDQGQTVITVCNYESYNKPETSTKTSKRPARDQQETSKRPKQKESKEGEEREETIYTQIFNHWNSKKIIVHKNFNQKFKNKINSLIKEKYSIEDFKKSIDNYCEVFFSQKTYFTHKWTMQEFFSRDKAFTVFLYKGVNDYLKDDKFQNVTQKSDRESKEENQYTTETDINDLFYQNQEVYNGN